MDKKKQKAGETGKKEEEGKKELTWRIRRISTYYTRSLHTVYAGC